MQNYPIQLHNADRIRIPHPTPRIRSGRIQIRWDMIRLVIRPLSDGAIRVSDDHLCVDQKSLGNAIAAGRKLQGPDSKIRFFSFSSGTEVMHNEDTDLSFVARTTAFDRIWRSRSSFV